MLAALLGFDHSEPFALDLGACGRAAHHTEAVVDEPDHVVEEAFAVFAFLQPGFDFLCHSMLGAEFVCLVYIATRQ